MSAFEIPQRVGSFAHAIATIDDGLHCAGLEQIGDEIQILLAAPGHKGQDLLPGERREDEQFEDAAENRREAHVGAGSDHHAGASWFEHPADVGQREISHALEDQVVLMVIFSETLLRVIEDAGGADRTDQLEVVCAADAGDFPTEMLRKLHGESADTSGCAIDKHCLPWLDMGFVAQSLEGR